jgi:hypothetical protein
MSKHLRSEHERLSARLKKASTVAGTDRAAGRLGRRWGEDLHKADEAEQRVIAEVRRLGQEVLEGWANEQVSRHSEALDRAPGFWCEG